MSLRKLIKFELKKLFRQKSAHAGFIVIAAVCILYFVLNYINRPAGTWSGADLIMETIYIQNNALFVLPFVAVLLAAHSFSEEALTGTLRTVMTRPVKRENIMIGKFVAMLVYMCCASYIILVISILLGLRWGYPDDFAGLLPRLLLIYLLYPLGTMVVVAFAFVVASFGTTPTITALAALGFHRVMIILESFSQIREYTFSYHVMNAIQLVVARSINTRLLYQSLVIILIYVFGLLLLASTLWEKRDITV